MATKETTGRRKKLGNLSEANFREWAQACVDKYEKADRPVDALVWSQIIAYYENALKAATPDATRGGGGR